MAPPSGRFRESGLPSPRRDAWRPRPTTNRDHAGSNQRPPEGVQGGDANASHAHLTLQGPVRLHRRDSHYLLLCLATACSSSDQAGRLGAEWEAQTDTLGDTVAVTTLAGSVWGPRRVLVEEMSIGELEGEQEYLLGQIVGIAVDSLDRVYLLDRLGPSLRLYDAGGNFVREVGSPGQGPGELGSPDSGLQILSDGRVAVRDPGNARIQLFDSTGAPGDTWSLRGGFNTSQRMVADTADHIFTPTIRDFGVPLDEWEHGMIEFGPTGDSLGFRAHPLPPFEEAVIEARVENDWSRNRVPFAPRQRFAFSRFGDYVHGTGERYAVDVRRRDGSTLRVAKYFDAVPTTSGERAAREALATRNLRSVDPGWTWNGPPIPDHKPAFRELYVSDEGDVWVLLHAPGIDTGEPAYSSEPGEARAPNRWTEPNVFDVFDRVGRYLGQVAAPDGLRTNPTPLIRGDRVWAVVTDEFDVQRLKRFRISTP